MSFRDNREPKLVEIKKEIQLNKQNNNNWSDSKSRQLIQTHATDPDLPYPINEIEDKIVAPDFNAQIQQIQNDIGQLQQDRKKREQELNSLIASGASFSAVTAKRDEIDFIDDEITNRTSQADILMDSFVENNNQSYFDTHSRDLVIKDASAKVSSYNKKVGNLSRVEERQMRASAELALLHKSWVEEDFVGLDTKMQAYKGKLSRNYLNKHPNQGVPVNILEEDVKEKDQAYNDECNKYPLDANGNLVCSKDELKEITRLKEEAQIARTFYNYDSKDYEAISNRFDEYECDLALKDQEGKKLDLLSKQDEVNKKGKRATQQDLAELQSLEDKKNASDEYILYLQGVNSFVANLTPAPGQPGPTPTPGQPGPTPAPGQPGPTPAPGQPGPTPAPGQPGPTPTPGQPGPTPTPGQPDQDDEDNEVSGNFFVRGVKKAANFVRKHKVQTALVVGYLAYKGYNHYSDGVFRNNVMNGFSNMNDRFSALNFNMTNNSAQLSGQMQEGFNGINNSIAGVGRQVEGVGSVVNSNAQSLSNLSEQVSNIKPSINNTTVVNMQTVVQQRKVGVVKTPSIPKDLPKQIDPKEIEKLSYLQGTAELRNRCLPDEKIAEALRQADLNNK